MKTYIKTESGDIVSIESKREYGCKNIQNNGTITTVGDTSKIDIPIMRHDIKGIIFQSNKE